MLVIKKVLILVEKSKICQWLEILKNWLNPKKPAKVKVNRVSATDFFTSKAKLIFIQLGKTFTKKLIFCYLDLKYQIWIETNTSGYAINKLFNQIILSKLFSNYVISKNPN